MSAWVVRHLAISEEGLAVSGVTEMASKVHVSEDLSDPSDSEADSNGLFY